MIYHMFVCSRSTFSGLTVALAIAKTMVMVMVVMVVVVMMKRDALKIADRIFGLTNE